MNRLLSCSVVKSTVYWLVSLVAVLHSCLLASAQTVVINATNRGWFTNSGSHNGPFLSTNNYYAGRQNGIFEYRNFFFFDLAGVSQPIASAKLALSAGNYFSLDPAENYELHDVTTPREVILATGIIESAYTDFGNGVIYGSRTMSYDDYGSVVEIELNSSAIATMNATHGPFGIGGSITTLSSVGYDEDVFGSTGSSQSVSVLRLTLVPEPSTLLLLGIGAISLLGRSRRRTSR